MGIPGDDMTHTPVYIAAPYASATEAGRLLNVARAVALARLAIANGLAPIVVHPMSVDLALVRMVAAQGGPLWVIASSAGQLSPGVRAVLTAYRENGAPRIRRATWLMWGPRFRLAGMAARWLELSP